MPKYILTGKKTGKRTEIGAADLTWAKIYAKMLGEEAGEEYEVQPALTKQERGITQVKCCYSCELEITGFCEKHKIGVQPDNYCKEHHQAE